MRRVICICMAVMLCLSIAGCGENKETNPTAVFREGKIVAEIGMTKDETIKNLGKCDVEAEDGTYIIHDYMQVWFQEDKVNKIAIFDGPYSDYLGNRIGKKYSGFADKNQVFDYVFYDEENNKIGSYRNSNAVPKDSDTCKYVIQYYNQDRDKKIGSIFLFDYQTFIHDN